MKKIFTLVVILFCSVTSWAYDFEHNGIYYNYLDAKNVEVTYRSKYHKYSGRIRIPSTVTVHSYTYNVAKIGDDAFRECTGLVTIHIPNSIRVIGSHAFDDCEHLQSIVIPNSVVKIEDCAFSGCRQLTSVNIPKGITSLPMLMFSGCYSLRSITIPKGVTHIDYGAFDYCKSLKSITIPDGVTTFDACVFMGCSSLTSINLPTSLTKMGSWVFRECPNLKTINFVARSLQEFCQTKRDFDLKYWYSGVDVKLVIAGKELTHLVIPEGTFAIEEGVFSELTSLKSISIPYTVTTISKKAFYHSSDSTSIIMRANSLEEYCRSYTNQALIRAGIQLPRKIVIAGQEIQGNLVLPCTMTIFRSDVFMGTKITSLTLTANSLEEYCNSTINHALNIAGIQLPRKIIIAGQEVKSDFVLPCTITNFKSDIFKGIEIKSLTLTANSVEEYCNSTINQLLCDNGIYLPRKLVIAGEEITDLTIPSSVTKIEDKVFSYFSNLTSITIPNSVTAIGENAFYNCTSLTSLTIPNSVTKIGKSVIKGCSALKNINISATTLEEYCHSSINMFLLNHGLDLPRKLMIDGKEVTQLVIPNGITQIREYLFKQFSYITSVTISSSVTSIGEEAFMDCKNLSSLTIPSSVTSIEPQAVRNTQIYNNQSNWTDGVLYIGDCLIESTYTLTKCTIKEGTRLIADHAFISAHYLKSVKFPKTLNYIGSHAFATCRSLKSVKLPKTITHVDKYAFGASTVVK